MKLHKVQQSFLITCFKFTEMEMRSSVGGGALPWAAAEPYLAGPWYDITGP